MNLVGKIFTVLIFLMCVVFGTFALMVHATHKNWKTEAYEFNRQLTEATRQKQELSEEKKNLETALNDEKERVKKRLIALEQETKNAIAQRNDMESKLLALASDNDKLALSIKAANQNIGVLQAAIDGMQKDLKLTLDERNKLQHDLVNATDSLMNAVNERQKLEKLGRELATQLLKAKEIIQYNHLTDNAKNPPAGLEGEVTAVPRPDVVEISIGADDGVRKGFKFVVTRPSTGKYIGVIEVIQVDYGNRAVCRTEKSSMNDQIQRGDHVKAYTKPR